MTKFSKVKNVEVADKTPQAGNITPQAGNITPPNVFISQLGELMYYKAHGTKQKFENLPVAEKNQWYDLAASARVSIDQMNQMLVPKVELEETENRRNKNHQILVEIIRSFVRGVKTLRCPKCGSTPDSRASLFPCEELAFRILDGKVK